VPSAPAPTPVISSSERFAHIVTSPPGGAEDPVLVVSQGVAEGEEAVDLLLGVDEVLVVVRGSVPIVMLTITLSSIVGHYMVVLVLVVLPHTRFTLTMMLHIRDLQMIRQ
jgi:hypothetical protein